MLTQRSFKGFTLIELLIAMGLGMLGIVVIFQVFRINEDYRRTTVNRSDAQTNGGLSLFFMERQIRSSGSGIVTTNEVRLAANEKINPNGVLGCQLLGTPIATGGIPSLRVAPVLIEDGGAGASDTIYVMSGTASLATSPTSASPITAGTTSFSIDNASGMRKADASTPSKWPADILLIGNLGKQVSGSRVSSSPCVLRRMSDVNEVAGPATVTLASAVPATASAFNTAVVHDLGPTAYFLRYRVVNNRLIETDFTPVLTGEGAAVDRVVAEGIINIQAQYGVDADQDDVVDHWVNPKDGQTLLSVTTDWSLSALMGLTNPVDAPGTNTDQNKAALSKIKAIRLSLVARSDQFEAPPNKTGDCVATPNDGGNFPASMVPLKAEAAASVSGYSALPAKPNGGFTAAEFTNAIKATAPGGAAATAGNDWQCFRYRLFETTVPMRNMLWSPL
jgi:type IV pilus assembly protein PilW